MTRTAHHEFEGTHQEVEISSDRSFGLVFAAAFALTAGYLAWRGSVWGPAFLAPSAAFLIIALVHASLLAPLNRLWAKFGLLLGAIVAPIIMALIYSIVFTPVGLFARLMGKDFLRLRLDPSVSTYWLPRQEQVPERKRLHDQF
jgi:hypothetical protein